MEWRKLKVAPDKYEINEDGVVRNAIWQIEIEKEVHDDGYEYVNLRGHNRPRQYRVCDLVAEAFLSHNKKETILCHKDGNILNNNYKNLVWKVNPDDLKVWDIIDEFPDYEINREGEIRNKHTKKHLSLNPNAVGYVAVCLHKDKKAYNRQLHVLIAQKYIPNPENKPIVNHIDENRANNNVNNLEWVDAKENANHGDRGEKIAHRRSVPVNEYDIYGHYIRTWVSVAAFGRHYNVAPSNVSAVARGAWNAIAGRQVRYYTGDLSDISPIPGAHEGYPINKYKKYDYNKPISPEYIYHPKSKREQVKEAIASIGSNHQPTLATRKQQMELIQSYILELEEKIYQFEQNIK